MDILAVFQKKNCFEGLKTKHAVTPGTKKIFYQYYRDDKKQFFGLSV
jgi:hypothetical protein